MGILVIEILLILLFVSTYIYFNRKTRTLSQLIIDSCFLAQPVWRNINARPRRSRNIETSEPQPVVPHEVVVTTVGVLLSIEICLNSYAIIIAFQSGGRA
jgi:hypothetical protein